MLYGILSVSVVFAFWLGYYLREVLDTLKRTVTKLEALRGAEAANKPPATGFAEPMTRAEVAGMLESERIALLNPDDRR